MMGEVDADGEQPEEGIEELTDVFAGVNEENWDEFVGEPCIILLLEFWVLGVSSGGGRIVGERGEVGGKLLAPLKFGEFDPFTLRGVPGGGRFGLLTIKSSEFFCKLAGELVEAGEFVGTGGGGRRPERG